MITVTILALVLVYKSFCNTVCIYMVMQIKLVVVVAVYMLMIFPLYIIILWSSVQINVTEKGQGRLTHSSKSL